MLPRTEIPAAQVGAIRRAMLAAPNTSSFQRLQCLWLRAQQELSTESIAWTVGLSVSHVRQVWSDYLRGGLAAAQGRPKGGRRHQNLTVLQEQAVLVPLQKEALAGRLVTARGIKTRYETTVGHTVPDSTVYRLLARHHWRQVQPRPKHPKDNPQAQAAFKKLQAKVAAVAAGHPDQPLRLMFEDEARFGRMSNPIRCWAPSGCRPEVPTHRVREYTHVIGSVSPQDGELISLILPHADTLALSLYLAEVSRRHPTEHILMFLDRAGWHQAQALVVPDNLTLDWLSPYSPQCNPQELVWREVRRQPFGNHDYDSMDAVEATLERRLRELESSPQRLQSLTGFDWIVNVSLKAR